MVYLNHLNPWVFIQVGRKISQSDENICQLDKVLISSGVVCLTSGINLHLPAVCHNNKTNCS